MDDTRHVASWIGGQEALHDRVLTLDEALAAVAAVDARRRSSELAGELFRDDALRLAAVAPGALPARARAAPAVAGMTDPGGDRARPASTAARGGRARPRPRAPAARRRWRWPGPSSRRWPGSGARRAGLVDLAEVRWRTGDLPGAGEAAAAALATRGRRGRSRWSSRPRRRPPSAAPARRAGSPTRAMAGCDRHDRRDLRRHAAVERLAGRCGRAAADGRRRCSIASPSRSRPRVDGYGTHASDGSRSPPNGSRTPSTAAGRSTLGFWDGEADVEPAAEMPARMRRPSSRQAARRSWPARSTRRHSASVWPCGSPRHSRRPSSRRPRAPGAPRCRGPRRRLPARRPRGRGPPGLRAGGAGRSAGAACASAHEGRSDGRRPGGRGPDRARRRAGRVAGRGGWPPRRRSSRIGRGRRSRRGRPPPTTADDAAEPAVPRRPTRPTRPMPPRPPTRRDRRRRRADRCQRPEPTATVADTDAPSPKPPPD